MTEEEALSAYEDFICLKVTMVTRHMPKSVDRAPLMNAGRVGFIDAWRKFQAGKKTHFQHYAAWRVKGEVLDEVRRTSAIGRWQLERRDNLEDARMQLAEQLLRDPTVEEVLDYLGLTGDWRRECERLLNSREPVSLGEIRNMPSEDLSPDVLAEQGEAHHIVRDGVARLSPDDRSFLDLFYIRQMKSQDIAAKLGVSPSRASQIRKEILERLRNLCLNELCDFRA